GPGPLALAHELLAFVTSGGGGGVVTSELLGAFEHRRCPGGSRSWARSCGGTTGCRSWRRPPAPRRCRSRIPLFLPCIPLFLPRIPLFLPRIPPFRPTSCSFRPTSHLSPPHIPLFPPHILLFPSFPFRSSLIQLFPAFPISPLSSPSSSFLFPHFPFLFLLCPFLIPFFLSFSLLPHPGFPPFPPSASPPSRFSFLLHLPPSPLPLPPLLPLSRRPFPNAGLRERRPLPQEPVAVLGQIGCDGNGKLNAKSVILEGDREHSAGGHVPLDLSELREYSLFPGQVVIVEGTNSTGKCLVASRLYEVPADPEPRTVLVACGPYTPSDGIGYEPLSDLLDVVARDKPDVCILFGPFLDAQHEEVENCRLLGSFSDIFKLCLKTIIEGTRSAGSRLVLVPSQRDVAHDPVYPQPPFSYAELPKEDKPRVHFVSDPCTLEIHGTVFGLTSTDLLFHMGAEEISSSPGVADRLTRILRHVLTQRSYYPLFPPAEGLNVDVEALCARAALPVTPHVLVLPSELRFFVKEVLGCVCVNPGRLTKGRAGGTFGRLLLRPPEAAAPRRNPCVSAHVLRI
uniref:DNA polymerase alpha subunit B n=1 Tax=Nothoprocta perdicaria TaxID=30464 RepID=A0A8C7EG78_NOTPE